MLTLSFPSIVAAALLLIAPIRVQQPAAPTPLNWGSCRTPPIEACFKHRGRLSTQNGVGQMLWLVGTKRIVAVGNSELPEYLSKYLDMTSPDHSDIYGDYEICPLERDHPGHMRDVCITGGTRLVVQDRERSRPAIRLLSTWPAGEK